jgi:hypothetical protein
MNLLALAAGLDTRWLLVALLGMIDLWAVVLVLRARASRRERLSWTAVILLCPVIGCMLWFVLGPKPTIAGGGGSSDGSWPRREEAGPAD